MDESAPVHGCQGRQRLPEDDERSPHGQRTAPLQHPARLTPLTASPTSAPPTAPADLAYAAVSRDASTYWRSGTAPGSSTPGQPCSVHAEGGCAGPVDQQGGGYVAHGDEAAVVALAAGQHGTTTAPPP
ncbi:MULTISPECIES: hypothetical protein [unclassified Streptomyces]|uniref:hypothetical protein n=1 Tax=unclassified Streptomyces TaxID=2593676 RepID=UPI003D8ACA3E